MNEAEVTAVLRASMARAGNGGSGEFAFLAQVRNDAGFNSTRTFDAMSLSLWPSRGHTLHVFEIKVSRGDWLRELKDPAKGEAACAIADRFSIVAPRGVVVPAELPSTWGLIEIIGDAPWKTRTRVSAPSLLEDGRKNRGPLPRGLVVAMLRSSPGVVPGGRIPSASEAEIARARAEGIAEGRKLAEADNARRAARSLSAERSAAEDWLELRARLKDNGLSHHETSPSSLVRCAAEIAQGVRGNRMDGAIQGLRSHVERFLDQLNEASK